MRSPKLLGNLENLEYIFDILKKEVCSFAVEKIALRYLMHAKKRVEGIQRGMFLVKRVVLTPENDGVNVMIFCNSKISA